MNLTCDLVAQMTDLSAVKANDGRAEIAQLIATAQEFDCYLVTALPAQTRTLLQMLGQERKVKVSGNVGFPSGGQTSSIKVAETRELLQLGVDEIDMVINIGALIAGQEDYLRDEILSVVDAACGIPVKVILECCYLTDEQILRGCDLCIEARASFIKTGTGWAAGGATVENVAMIKKHVGSSIGIKASGGIRDIGTIEKLIRAGADRFGIGMRSFPIIMQEIRERERQQ
ncbi:MAG: deoxyribose-phosphate aldolase [Anaerolineaceae bacterium]|nr:deoxyribose-phosphate aldolase [Anaerolineaceae bacterium]